MLRVRADLEALQALDAATVVLDTYAGAGTGCDQHRLGWSLLAKFANEVADLAAGVVR